MGIRQRITGAFKALAGQQMLRAINPVATQEPPVRSMRDLLEGYESMPGLRAVANLVGTKVATERLELLAPMRGGKAFCEPVAQRSGYELRAKALDSLRKAGSLQEIDNHVFFDALETPNDFMGRLGLMKITTIHLDLVGDAFWLKDRNKLGAPVGFWPIPPHWVVEMPVPSRPSFRVSWRTWQVEIPVSEMVWFHEPQPSNPYARGSGIGWSLGDEYEVDEYAAKMAKQLFFNRARPDFLVMGGEGASETEMKRLERDWVNRLQGFWRAHKPYFLAGKVDIHEFQQPTMEQTMYPALRRAQRDIIIQTWGVPPEMFGIQEGRSALVQTNYEGAEYLMAKNVIMPRLERMRDVLQRLVMTDYDKRLIVHYDSPVPEDKKYKLDVMRAAAGAFRIDDWRDAAGEEPLGGPEGQALLVPVNMTPTQSIEDLINQRLAAAETARVAAESPAPAVIGNGGSTGE